MILTPWSPGTCSKRRRTIAWDDGGMSWSLGTGTMTIELRPLVPIDDLRATFLGLMLSPDVGRILTGRGLEVDPLPPTSSPTRPTPGLPDPPDEGAAKPGDGALEFRASDCRTSSSSTGSPACGWGFRAGGVPRDAHRVAGALSRPIRRAPGAVRQQGRGGWGVRQHVRPDRGHIGMSETIRIEGLTRRYGSTVAVSGADLAVDDCEILGLVGPNGAGKTTTLRMLATLLVPSRGRRPHPGPQHPS